MNILEVNKLSKSYDGKTDALSNCSFSLAKGKICAVVGESGGGKSTLLRLVAGLERPNYGTIKIGGNLVSSSTKIIAPQQRNVGMVFQDFALFPHLTVFQNIAFGLKVNKTEKVNELLQLIKMEDFAKAYPHTLSGGQEQRVAIARTLALHPKLLLLDEPFSNLDYNLKSTLRMEIRELIKKINVSMLFITHDISDALDIAEEIIFMKNGVMLWHGSISELSQNIQNKEVQQIITETKINAEKIIELLK